MTRTSHPDYELWRNMRRRCNDKKHKDYVHYGAKGIGYDKRWDEFWLFVEDMGSRPSKVHSIDRIDNILGYFKENCRWATSLEQTKNRRLSFECLKGHKWDNKNTMSVNNGKYKTKRCRICYNERIARDFK